METEDIAQEKGCQGRSYGAERQKRIQARNDFSKLGMAGRDSMARASEAMALKSGMHNLIR